jgi:hypothetical protein
VAAPPLDSTCDGPVTYPGDIKTLVKSSKKEMLLKKIFKQYDIQIIFVHYSIAA